MHELQDKADASILGVKGRKPPNFELGVVGAAGGRGRVSENIYRILHRKYVRKRRFYKKDLRSSVFYEKKRECRCQR